MTADTAHSLLQADRRRRDIMSRADGIPALPEVVVQALQLLGNPETEPEQLGVCLRSDPVLIGKMLALVNSPFYGAQRTVVNVADAIMVLGFRGLRSLVLASSTSEFLERDYAAYGHDYRGLWRHSVAVATICRELATDAGLGIEQREELFIAGLLHDIGKMVLLPYIMESSLATLLRIDPSYQRERELIGIDHAEAGALVVAKWNLTGWIQECIRHHHEEGEAEDLHEPLAVLRLANSLAHELGHGYDRKLVKRDSRSAGDRLEELNFDGGRWQDRRAELADTIGATLSAMSRT